MRYSNASDFAGVADTHDCPFAHHLMVKNFLFMYPRDLASLPRLLRHQKYRRVLLPLVYHQTKAPRSTSSMISSSFNVNTSDVENALDSSPYTYIFGNAKFSRKINKTIQALKDFTDPLPVFLYLYDVLAKKLILNPIKIKNKRCIATQPMHSFSNLSSYVAREKRVVSFNNSVPDYETPHGYGLEGFSHQGLLVGPVLGVPLLSQEGDLIGVLELAKEWNETMFRSSEIDVVVMISEMIATNIDLHHKIQKCEKMISSHDFQIETLKKYLLFKGVVRGHLYQKLLKHVRKMTGAVSMSYALTEMTDDGLVGDYVEESAGPLMGGSSQYVRTKMKLEENGSLMGWVAHNRKPVCIADGVNDIRVSNDLSLVYSMNRECVLCYPITINDDTVGVIQLTNKNNSLSFSDVDKSVTKLGCDYAAIAVYRKGLISKLLDISNRTTKLKKLLPLYATVCSHDFVHGIESCLVSTPVVPGPFECHWSSIIDNVAFWILFMLSETVAACYPNLKLWAIWVLLVKKTYDDSLPYHNFNHAAESLYCMYNILGNNSDLFSEEEMCAMMISCLCCDVGHVGFNCHFYELSDKGFGKMYSTCPLESGHAALAITLLRRVPILSTYSDEQVKSIVKDVRDCILGTNIPLHTTQVLKLKKLMRYKKFSWKNEYHRSLVKCVLVMCASLSDQIKMSTLIPSKEAVSRELSRQVELEMTRDYSPISLMKGKYDQQYYYIKYVCLPCMELIAKILPNTVQLHSMVESVIGTYEAGDCKGMWKPDTSYEQSFTKDRAARRKSVIISALTRKNTPQPKLITVERDDIRSKRKMVLEINHENAHLWYTYTKPVVLE